MNNRKCSGVGFFSVYTWYVLLFTRHFSSFLSTCCTKAFIFKTFSSLLIHRLREKGNLLTKEGGKLACRTSFMRSERFSLTFDSLRKMMFVWIRDINNSVILLSYVFEIPLSLVPELVWVSTSPNKESVEADWHNRLPLSTVMCRVWGNAWGQNLSLL